MLKQFGIHKPLIQAPMAGVTSPKFVAACCEAGILGMIGAGYLDGQQTKAFIQEVRTLTSKPFGVNVFIQGEPKIDITVLQQARSALQPIYEDLQIESTPKVVSKDFYSEQMAVILEENIKIISFTFGLPTAEMIAHLKANDVYLIGTATTVEEAFAVEAAGMDAVVLQGSEAGGHRGSFQELLQFISLQQLLTATSKLSIPAIATGGLMTAEHIQQALASGAAAAQVGTVLLVANECEVSDMHKQAIFHSKKSGTCLTKAFTGKLARGLVNEFTEQLKDAVVAPYPLQHHLTTEIRKVSTKNNRPEYLSLWMGENSYMAKSGSVEQIIATLI